MCLTLADTLISVVGIEKIVPTVETSRSSCSSTRNSTGERMNPYTSMWTGPASGDGPQTMHVVLIDNGRTQVLSGSQGAARRCAASAARPASTSAPVYEKVGGHMTRSVIGRGPIGAVLTPQLRGVTSAVDASLPYASTLCAGPASTCVPSGSPCPTCWCCATQGRRGRGEGRRPPAESAIIEGLDPACSPIRACGPPPSGALGGKALDRTRGSTSRAAALAAVEVDERPRLSPSPRPRASGPGTPGPIHGRILVTHRLLDAVWVPGPGGAGRPSPLTPEGPDTPGRLDGRSAPSARQHLR